MMKISSTSPRHNVSQEEVEDICFGLNISRRERNRRYVVSGQTVAGRYLTVVVERVHKGVFKPITAFEMAASHKQLYKRRMGR